MYPKNIQDLYELIKDYDFNWYNKEALQHLNNALKNCKNDKIKKEISAYVLGKVAYIDDSGAFFKSDLSYTGSLKELKQTLYDTTETLKLYKEIYNACDVKDDILNKFMDRIFNNILKAVNEYFMDIFSDMTGKSVDINVLNEDKYFTALKYPFTLKELSDYRKKIAKIYHPDNGGNEEDMAKINEIFNVLKLMI